MTGKLGYELPTTPKSTQKPTTADIAWAAGIYEGEGAVNKVGCVSVTQKNRWLPIRLKRLYGGKVYKKNGTKTYTNKTYHQWYVSGARGRGFLMTIYSFLSPQKQKMIRERLE